MEAYAVCFIRHDQVQAIDVYRTLSEAKIAEETELKTETAQYFDIDVVPCCIKWEHE